MVREVGKRDWSRAEAILDRLPGRSATSLLGGGPFRWLPVS